MNPKNLFCVLGIGCAIAAMPVAAQETNDLPRTRLESFETNTGIILIRGFGQVGSVAANNRTIMISCREDLDPAGGQREYGISVSIATSAGREERVIVDYDELDPILNAIDYLNRLDWTITSLSSFDASYTTKAGLRVSAMGWNRTGTIEFALRGPRMVDAPILMTRDELAHFRGLLEEAKRKLDGIRKDH
jgi:hypothetical protein